MDTTTRTPVERIAAERDALESDPDYTDVFEPATDGHLKLAYLLEAVGQIGGSLLDGTTPDEQLVRLGALTVAWLEART